GVDRIQPVADDYRFRCAAKSRIRATGGVFGWKAVRFGGFLSDARNSRTKPTGHRCPPYPPPCRAIPTPDHRGRSTRSADATTVPGSIQPRTHGDRPVQTNEKARTPVFSLACGSAIRDNQTYVRHHQG